MKEKFLIIIFFLSLHSYSQNLVKYKIDENVSINVPEGFEETEWSEQMYVRAFIDNSIVLVTKSSEKYSGVKISNESELLEYYEGVLNGILKSSEVKLEKNNIIEINGLKVLKVSSDAIISDERKICDHFVFSLKGFTYSVQFIHSDVKDENFEKQRQKIISSIDFQI